jgi:hypothetical protein
VVPTNAGSAEVLRSVPDLNLTPTPTRTLGSAIACQVVAHEVEPGLVYEGEQVKVSAFAVSHGTWPSAFGYRFEARLRTIAGVTLLLAVGICRRYTRTMLNPTPITRRLDKEGRPYFMWDDDLEHDELVRLLAEGTDAQRAYLIGKIMRQAKPDDVFEYVKLVDIGRLWPQIVRYLGHTRDFWTWLLGRWEQLGYVQLERR